MDPRFQTSFIPKKPIVAQAKVHSVSSINLLTLIATTIFLVALACGGAAFFFNQRLGQQIVQNKATLDRAKEDFQPELISQIVKLDSRIQISKQLLANHVTILPIFDYIGTITLKTVRFRDFSFSYLAKDKVIISMKGQAQGYASVALQSDLLYQQKLLTDTQVSDMVLDPSGSVLFNVTAALDPSLISYATALAKTTQPSQPQTQTQAQPQAPAQAQPQQQATAPAATTTVPAATGSTTASTTTRTP